MAITKNKTTADGSKEIATPEVRTEIDPRSKILTNQESPYNRIAVGD